MQRVHLAAGIAVVSTTGVLALAGIAGGDGKRGDDRTLFGDLNGRNEIGPDGRRGAGDPDGRGGATGTIKEQPGDTSTLCVALTFKNLGTPTASHIHRGRRNENGPVVVGFFGPPTQTAPPASGDPGAFAGCVEITDLLAAELLDNPRGFYWNVHTSEFGPGAIRGQVRLGRGAHEDDRDDDD
jgi:hypothetical protein